MGYGYLHNAVDDHSRLAYSEILADERKETAAAFWIRANAYFTGCGVTVIRVLTDNGGCPPVPAGPTDRFNRTLREEWAYAQPYRSETEPVAAFADWLHSYDHHRGHTALAGKPPASRVTNVSG